MPLKHLGFADFPMMIGLSFPPLALTKRAHVRRSLDLFPPVQLRDLSARDLLGRALKNWPVSSIFQMFSGDHPCKISGSLSLHDSTISSLTPPASPDMHLALMPFLFLNRSSHPFEALKSSCDKSKASAICLTFSCNIGPVTGIFLLLAFRNQSNFFFQFHHDLLLCTVLFCNWRLTQSLSQSLLSSAECFGFGFCRTQIFLQLFSCLHWGLRHKTGLLQNGFLNQALVAFVCRLCKKSWWNTTFLASTTRDEWNVPVQIPFVNEIIGKVSSKWCSTY